MEEFLSVNVEKYYNQNDLTSKNNNYNFTKPKWKLRKNRRKQIILIQTSLLQWTFFILCFCLLLLPVPHNAMPVPKVEDENSLTSAMVRLFLTARSGYTILYAILMGKCQKAIFSIFEGIIDVYQS